MALTLKNPWPILTPNSSKKVSLKQKVSNENVGTEFISIGQFINGLVSGTIPFEGISIIRTQTTTQTSNYTASITDSLIVMDTTASALTLTLPPSNGILGKHYTIFNIGTKNLTINPTGSDTINGGTSIGLPGQWLHADLFATSPNWVAM